MTKITKLPTVGVATIMAKTASIHKQMFRLGDTARRYSGNLTGLQRKHLLEWLAEIEEEARKTADVIATGGKA